MNPLDRKLAAVFKALNKGAQDEHRKQKTSKEFGQIRGRVVDESLGKRLELLFSEFSRPPAQRRRLEVAESQTIIRDLLNRSFVETSALLFVTSLDAIKTLDQDEALAVAPNLNCIKAWIKATRLSPGELESRLLAQPAQTYATAGADWLLECAKPDSLPPLLDLFLNRQSRPSYLPSWKDGLVSALKKDRRGNLLSATLNHRWSGGESIAALAEAVCSDRSALKMTVDLLPAMLARKDGSQAGVSLVAEMFRTTTATDNTERELMTVLLARLGTGILLAERKSPQSEAALEFIRNTNRQLRNLTKEDVLQSRTWLFENLCHYELPTDRRLHLTPEGLRHLAIAFAKADQGFVAKEILILTARNLGLSSIGKKGETVSYNPLIHEDVEGGLVTGHSVVIEESGWGVNQEAVIRAKVKRV